MKYSRLFLAFGLGFVTAAALFGLFGSPVKATGPDELTSMENRLRDVEKAAEQGQLPQTVKAPFSVFDPVTNKLIFYVNDDHVDLYNKKGQRVVWIDGRPAGGQITTASTGDKNIVTRFGAVGETAGLTVEEDGKPKIDLGRRPDKGTYRLLFFSPVQDKFLAGIGQSEGGTGLAFVSDTSGNPRAKMYVTGDSQKGLVVVSAADGSSLAELTEGASKGGAFALFNNKGENMVIAGEADAGGFGVVRAGPGSFMPGYGTLGLPGSFILGKRK